MRFYADLHLHSKHARATSRDLDLEHMALWAAKKGVTVLGTGDFTHPQWLAEIKEKLAPAEPGLFRLKPEWERWAAAQFPAFARQPVRFLLEVEISTIYKKGDRTRKVHHLHYMPDLAAAERFIARLARIGNLNADGRPILGLDSRHLLEITLEAGEGAYLIPAHIWTPWFAVLGSKSGFDTIEECYGDLTPHIFAVETGLSSDPPMNWRLSQLDRYTLVSNSDAHSPGKIGREACAFDCELDYWAMRRALETRQGYGGTVEFFPEEGKYHLDGHRACNVCFEPEETRRHGGRCPACGKELTIGVMHRVAALADRPEGVRPEARAPFRSFVPLPEVLGEIQRVGAGSRKVADAYEHLVGKLGSELFILEEAPVEALRQAGSELFAEGIVRMREGRVTRQAGYDGEYGVIRLFRDEELVQGNAVSLLFDLPKRAREDAGKGKRALRIPPDETTSPADAQQTVGRSNLELNDRPDVPAPARAEGQRLGSGAAPTGLPRRCDPLAGLDPDQRAAAEIAEGPLMIIAGPGTGKTRTLTHRLAHLITARNVPPEQCLAVTFTNRAANEMRERLHQLLPGVAAGLTVTTFHGFGYRLLREHGARWGLPADARVAAEAERIALLGEVLKLSEARAERLLREISSAKCGMVQPDGELTFALQTYLAAMRQRGWLDFDDLIGLPLDGLAKDAEVREQCRRRFGWVAVDEFQDIDARQYRLISLLVLRDGNLCVIGDPDQAIYSFRGAEPRFFDELLRDHPGTRRVLLRRNYRSGRSIVQGALQAIAPATLVADRVLETSSADATRITIHEAPTDKAEAEFVVHTIERLIGGSGFFSFDSGRVEGTERGGCSFGDFAVLYRTEAQAPVLTEALARSGIPFQQHSHRPLMELPVVRSVLAAIEATPAGLPLPERLQAAGRQILDAAAPLPGDQESVLRQIMAAVLEPLACRCGADLGRFQSELALSQHADLWDARADRVSLLTLHASKGLEFAVVFVVGCEDGLLPLRFGPDDGSVNLEEERRLLFVGMTRARERLLLSHAKQRWWRGQLREQVLSPMVTDIQQELLERSRSRAFTPKEKPAGVQLDFFGANFAAE